MKKISLSRRAVLRGAGGGAIGLPWLEVMSPRRAARAAAVPARRFLAVFQPGGTVLSKWTPTGTETSFTLSPILSPLAPVKDKILIPGELDMTSAVGDQRAAGIIAWLTGTKQTQTNLGAFAGGPSIDQILATSSIGANRLRQSLYMAVRWGTGRSHGVASPWNISSFANPSPFEPLTPALDPIKIWQDLFGTKTPGGGVAAWDKSILDLVDRRYARLAARLGAADKQRLEQHLTQLRAIEQGVASTARCLPPALVDTSDYNPTSGLNSADDGSIVDLATDTAIPKVGKLMMDMMVMAFACDLTAVGTLQWSDTEAKHTFPWLGLPETYAYYQNDGGYQPVAVEKVCTWYSTQHAYLIQEMAKVDMGGHTLLDESVVFIGSERQGPADYSKASMPFVLAGGGGGLRGGRWVTYNHIPHNNLLLALLGLFGVTRATLGDAVYCQNPITNLT
jgi:Protein of unknown function (DUF1552)